MAVLKSRAGTYKVRFRVQGQQRQKTFRNDRAAVSFDEKTKTQLRDGDYIAPSEVTVKEMMEKFLEAGKTKGVTKKPKPWKEQMYLYRKNHAENYITPRFGDKKATSLKTIEVEMAGAEWAKSVRP